MLYEYDPISCIGMKVSTKDNLTTDEAEWGVYKTGGSAGEKTNYFVIEGLTEEQARKRAKSRMQGLSAGEKQYYKIRYVAKKVHDAKTKDEEQYYHFKSSEGEEYFGTEADLKNLISHFTPSEKKEWGKTISKTPMTKEQVTKWRNNAMNKLGL